jgi:ceramide glucosyltransferase
MNQLLVGTAAIGTVASTGYCVLCLWAGFRFASQRKRVSPAANDLPPVSILKPLKGTDPEMFLSLRSHCVQDYPDYEIIFGISDPNDPALAVVKKLQREFPTRTIRLLLCQQKLGTNGKVSTLAQIVPEAKHEFLLVNDSDIRVGPDYLRTVMAELQEPDTGLVTCLYRGVPAPTIASRIESLGISTDFTAGVLAARQLEGGLQFGLGATLAFRRSDLKAIGGFETIVDYLADDYELGHRISEQNLKVKLSQAVVETFLPAYDFAGFFSHQLRWARTIRAARPSGYAGLLLTFTLPWAILTLLLARGAGWAWVLFTVAVVMRVSMALAVGGSVLRDKEVLRSWWLIPVRDFLALVVWFQGLFGRRILWRGEVFQLRRGKLQRPE